MSFRRWLTLLRFMRLRGILMLMAVVKLKDRDSLNTLIKDLLVTPHIKKTMTNIALNVVKEDFKVHTLHFFRHLLRYLFHDLTVKHYPCILLHYLCVYFSVFHKSYEQITTTLILAVQPTVVIKTVKCKMRKRKILSKSIKH